MAFNVGKLEAYFGLNLSSLTADLATAQRQMQRTGRNMSRVGRQMSVGITLPLVAAGTASVKMAADFEQSMSKIVGLVGVASKEVQGFTKDVKNLAGQTARSPLELADALFFVTSAGLRGQDALNVLEASAKASAAGLGETKIVADLVTSAVNAYGVANLNATQATDILVSAVREGKAEAVDLASSMGQVLPIASALQVSFDQVGAAVASMTRTGTNAATASIQLRQILASLLKPSNQAEEAMIGMGTSSAELRKQLREEGLISVLGFLAEQMKTNEQAMAEVFPNIRALSGALDIMGGNAEENVAIFQRMTDTAGTLESAFKTASETASFKFNKALAELKVAGIELGEQLLPIAIDLVNAMRSLAEWFTGLSDAGKKMALSIAGILAVAGPLLVILGSMAVAIGSISLPIIAVVAGLTALALAIVWVTDNWEALKERFTDISWWRNALIDMIQFFIEYNPFNWVWKAYNKLRESLGMQPLEGIFEQAANALEGLKGETKEYEHEFTSLGDSIINTAKKISDALFGLSSGSSGLGTSPGAASLPAVQTGGTRNFGSGGFDFSNFGAGVSSSMGLINRTIQITNEHLRETKKTVFELGTAMQNVLNTAFAEFGETLGNVFTGDAGAQGFFSNLLLIVADFASQFGKALIAAGVAALAFKNLLINPIAAIAAGIALVAASTVVKNLLTKGPGGGQIQGLASGGYVTQGGVFQLHRDEVVALPAGSAVTPAASARGGTLTTRIGLRELIIELRKEEKRMGR